MRYLSTNSLALVTTVTVLATFAAPARANVRANPRANPLDGRTSHVEVTSAGAFVVDGPLDPTTARGAGSGTQNATAGPIWTHPDGGLAWMGGPVSLGNHGSEVFTAYDLNNEADALFSCFDTDPPTALWTQTAPFGSEDHHVDSAEATGTKISLHTTNPGQPSAQTVLRKYSSGSSTPDWSYTFRFPTNGGTNCAISRDGQTIVAAATDPASNAIEIVVLGPSSNTPVSVTSFPTGPNNALHGFDLSADGSTLYFTGGTTLHIFDIATTTDVFPFNIGAGFDSHAISGDGSVFAFGNFNAMRVFQKIGGTYQNTITRTLSGAVFCARVDISDDSSTVAYGWWFYNPGLVARVEAVDVQSQALLMSDTITGTGQSQNLLSGISINADGSRFAVGLWGDDGGLAAEMRLYARDQNAPLGTVNLPGSVFGISISADGQRMVAASKAVHANQFGNGGRIDLYGDASPYTNSCFGDGSLATACPCTNFGTTGHGCNNSQATGGALLTGAGSTNPDNVVLTSSGERTVSLTVFFQGTVNNANGVFFGDGVRCAAGTIKRIGVKISAGGTATYPEPGDLSISARSAAVGDPIAPGSMRIYQTQYRDAVPTFCAAPTGGTFNSSNAVQVIW